MSTELFNRLKAYVTPGASVASTASDEYLQACLDEAIALVDNRCGAAKADVPVAVLQRAYIEVGSELFNRQSAPNGISQFASADGSPIRIARDPMVAAEPILRPFLTGGFA